MTLLVEDGSGIAGASSYIAVAGADAYFAAQANATWAALGPVQKDANLVAGCRYIENTYRGKWKGYRAYEKQGLAWPRVNSAPLLYNQLRIGWVYPATSYLTDLDGFPIYANTVPQRVKDAQCEAALLVATGFDFTQVSNAVVKSASWTVDRVSSTDNFAGAASQRDPKLVAIDQLLLGLILAAPGATFGNVQIRRG